MELLSHCTSMRSPPASDSAATDYNYKFYGPVWNESKDGSLALPPFWLSVRAMIAALCRDAPLRSDDDPDVCHGLQFDSWLELKLSDLASHVKAGALPAIVATRKLLEIGADGKPCVGPVRVAERYTTDECPGEWLPASFQLLKAFVLEGADLCDFASPGAPVSPEFLSEWRRLFEREGQSGRFRYPAASDRDVEFTTKVVLTLDDLARSLNVPDDLPIQVRAHKVSVTAVVPPCQ